MQVIYKYRTLVIFSALIGQAFLFALGFTARKELDTVQLKHVVKDEVKGMDPEIIKLRILKDSIPDTCQVKKAGADAFSKKELISINL